MHANYFVLPLVVWTSAATLGASNSSLISTRASPTRYPSLNTLPVASPILATPDPRLSAGCKHTTAYAMPPRVRYAVMCDVLNTSDSGATFNSTDHLALDAATRSCVSKTSILDQHACAESSLKTGRQIRALPTLYILIVEVMTEAGDFVNLARETFRAHRQGDDRWKVIFGVYTLICKVVNVGLKVYNYTIEANQEKSFDSTTSSTKPAAANDVGLAFIDTTNGTGPLTQPQKAYVKVLCCSVKALAERSVEVCAPAITSMATIRGAALAPSAGTAPDTSNSRIMLIIR